MDDAALKATLQRLDADQTPCPCLKCWCERQLLFPPVQPVKKPRRKKVEEES